MNPNQIRRTIAQMVTKSGEGHIPSAFSIVDIIHSIYTVIPDLGLEKCRHKFILSKGHGCAALYVVLASKGLIDWEDIKRYGLNGSSLGGHPDRNKQSGVESNSGSLGHGFPFAVGVALANKIKALDSSKTYVLLGDGECQEGTTWEAASIAVNQSLNNLIVIVDWNGSAAQLQPKEFLRNKWEAFGWHTMEIDGHNVDTMSETLHKIHNAKNLLPTVILARTTKGKGVSFLEGHGQWHHKIPNAYELELILKELK